MRKMINGIAAVLAVSALMAGSAFAADKLIVKDPTGATNVFTVTDAGAVVATGGFMWDAANKKLGLNSAAPQAPLHLVDSSILIGRGFLAAQHNDGNHAAVIAIRKSRGTETAPAAVQYDSVAKTGDFIATIHSQAYDGSAYQNGASFAYRIDGPVSAGNTPTAWYLYTGNSQTTKQINLMVNSAGNTGVGTTTPSQRLEVNGGVRLNTAAAKPTCDATVRGTNWFTQGGTGVADSFEVCSKDAAGSYAWRALY